LACNRASSSSSVDTEMTSTTTLVSASSMTRYHRPDCPLVSGKEVRPLSEARHRARGRRACHVCHSGDVDGRNTPPPGTGP
jgi:hypothetical protein